MTRKLIAMTPFYRFALAYILPAFLAFCILWKGGKSLEATWILTGMAWLLTLARMRVRGKGEAIPMTLWGAMLLFVLWTIASYVFSSTRNYGLDEVLRDGSYFLLFLFSIGEARAEGSRFVPRFLSVLSWSAIAASLIGIAVYVLQPVNRFVGTFFDFRFQTDYWPNAWGDFVLLSWPVLLWVAIVDRRTGTVRNRNDLFLRLAGLGILFGCFFLSYSRGSFLAFLGQVALLVLLTGFFVLLPLMRSAKRPAKLLKFLFPPLQLKGVIGGSLLGIFFVFMMSFGTFRAVNAVRAHFFPVQSVLEKATFTAAEGASSIDERAQFWKQALALSLEKPLLGWGPYSFRFVQPRLQEGVFATSDHPHNVILKAALERGWPAAFLHIFALLFIAWMGLGWLWMTRGSLTKQSDFVLSTKLPVWGHALLVCALLTSLGGTLAHSMIDYNLQFVANGLLFWILCALVLAFALPAAKAQTRLTIGSEVALASFLMLLAIFEGQYLITSSLGRHAEKAGDPGKALAWYEISTNERFSRDMHLSRAHLLLEGGLPDSALRALDDYFAVNHEDARAWLLKAQALEAKGDWTGAVAAYQQALALGKYNYIDAVRGLAAMAEKTRDQALLTYLTLYADPLLTEYTEAIEHNVHFIALTPNVESLAETLDILSWLRPEQAIAYQTMRKRAVGHATIERERLSGRSPGLLW
jgi:O-antigen ligase